MTVHLAESDAELTRIRTVLVAHEIRALVVEQNEIRDVVSAHWLALNHRRHRIGFECRKQSRIAHSGSRVDSVTHPLPASLPECARRSIVQVRRQPEAIGVRGPVARLLIVACQYDWRSIQLTRSMTRERRRRSVDAALCQYDRATSRRELPHICQRQGHQIARLS